LNEDAERKVNEMHEMVYCPEPYKYLKENRGLSDDLIKNWRLGWHPGARRIAVPQYDFSGRLVNIGGRFIPSVVDFFDPPKWMHAKGFKREAFLFGEERLQLSEGRSTIFIVEGMFDAIYLIEKGIPNVVAILGSDLAFFQIQKIIYWANHLVIVPDGDDKGFKAAKKIQEQLGKKLNVSMFNTPMGKDPDELSDREIDLLKSRFLP
jgi:DNA primase